MLVIDGLKGYETKQVNLDKYFEDVKTKGESEEPKHFVIVRPLPPHSEAEITERTMKGMIVNKQETTTFKMDTENRLAIRNIKLRLNAGVEDHNFTSNGKKIPWDQKFIDILDKANPSILKDVVKAINELSGTEEDGDTPT